MKAYRLFFIFLASIATYFLVVERNVYLWPFDTPKNNFYVYSHSLLSKLTQFGNGRFYLVLNKTDRELNRHPEIAKMPGYMGGSGYIFPFLTAFNQSDLSVVSVSEYCSQDVKGSIGIFSPDALDYVTENEGCIANYLIRLDSGYAIDAPEKDLKTFFTAFSEEYLYTNHFSRDPVNLEMLFHAETEWELIERPWGDVVQGLLISKEKTIDLYINDINGSEGKRWLVFGKHPGVQAKAHDRLLTSLPRLYVPVADELEVVEPRSANVTYFVPLESEYMKVQFTEDDYVSAYGGYVLYLHDPRVTNQKQYFN